VASPIMTSLSGILSGIMSEIRILSDLQPVEKKNSSLCFIFNKSHTIAHNTLSYSLFLQDEQRQRISFGLSELKKGYFPHFFNTTANQHYVGPYPAAHYYNPDDMSVVNRQAFFSWYEQQKDKVFNFQEEI
jgi:hypothetical protein